MNKTILILAANPQDTPHLRLEQEVRDITESLNRKGHNKFKIEYRLAARPKDVRRAMLDFQPAIVHFCGHGGKEGIAFEDESGNHQIVDEEALGGFFKLFADEFQVECVVLNACYSEFQARAIARYVDYVVGMSKKITDKAALEFSVAFYDAMSVGKSINLAFDLACNAIQWAGLPEHETPQLKSRFLESAHHKTIELVSAAAEQIDTDLPINNRAAIDSSLIEISELIADLQDALVAEIKSSGQDVKQKLEGLADKVAMCSQKLDSQSFQVAVMALAKSGKSTLINAWLGNEFLPVSNTPETAHIVRIAHSPAALDGVLTHHEQTRRGVAEIRAYLTGLNAQQRNQPSTNAQHEIELLAPLQVLNRVLLDDFKFQILDTPGPNEAGMEVVKLIITSILDSADAIIYVLDYTKLKTDEEQQMFSQLKTMREGLIKEHSSRMFFVVNKMDVQDRNGLTPDETISYVSDLLNKQLEGLSILPKHILLVSARNALLARLVQGGTADKKQIEDFARVAVGVKYKQLATIDACRPYAQILLDDSNVQSLEESILSYIYVNRRRIFLQAVLDDLERYLNTFSNHLATFHGTLKANQVEMRQEVYKMERKLQDIVARLEEIGGDIQSFKKNAKEKIDAEFNQFRDIARNHVQQVFERTDQAKKDPQTIFSDILQTVRAEAARYRLEELNKAEVRTSLSVLNERISELLQMDLNYTEQQLQSALFREQSFFIQKLEKKITPLAREIEYQVGKSLNITIEPVSLKMPLPTHTEFAHNLERDIDKLIESRKHFKPRVVSKRIGWIPWFSIQIRETLYSASSESYRKHLDNQIGQMVEDWLSITYEVIDGTFLKTYEVAHEELVSYANGFLVAAKDAIQTGKKKEEQRKKVLMRVARNMQGVRRIAERLLQCRNQLLEISAMELDAPSSLD